MDKFSKDERKEIRFEPRSSSALFDDAREAKNSLLGLPIGTPEILINHSYTVRSCLPHLISCDIDFDWYAHIHAQFKFSERNFCPVLIARD